MRGLWRFRAGCWSLGTVGLGAQLRHVVRRCSCFWRSSADAWLEVSKREPGTHYLSLERSKGWKCSKSRHKPVQVHHLYLIRNFQFYAILHNPGIQELRKLSRTRPYGRCRSKASPGLWHANFNPQFRCHRRRRRTKAEPPGNCSACCFPISKPVLLLTMAVLSL